jgi:hypothetical protein
MLDTWRSRRTLAGASAAAAFTLVSAAPAFASDEDEQVWASVTATTALSDRIDATLELHGRQTDDVSRLGQTLVRPSLTLKLGNGWSAAAGYAYAHTRFAGTAANVEHRAWQQVAYTFRQDAGTGLAVTGRTRMEQRFRPDASGTGWRLRQQLRAQIPLSSAGKARAVVWNETFVGLNTTEWDRHPGVDQVRTFLGVSVPVAKGISAEPGYLNQTIFRIGPDRINHILAVNLFARF